MSNHNVDSMLQACNMGFKCVAGHGRGCILAGIFPRILSLVSLRGEKNPGKGQICESIASYMSFPANLCSDHGKTWESGYSSIPDGECPTPNLADTTLDGCKLLKWVWH